MDALKNEIELSEQIKKMAEHLTFIEKKLDQLLEARDRQPAHLDVALCRRPSRLIRHFAAVGRDGDVDLRNRIPRHLPTLADLDVERLRRSFRSEAM